MPAAKVQIFGVRAMLALEVTLINEARTSRPAERFGQKLTQFAVAVGQLRVRSNHLGHEARLG